MKLLQRLNPLVQPTEAVPFSKTSEARNLPPVSLARGGYFALPFWLSRAQISNILWNQTLNGKYSREAMCRSRASPFGIRRARVVELCKTAYVQPNKFMKPFFGAGLPWRTMLTR